MSGAYVTPDNDPPTADEILADFWSHTFNDLYGFDFKTALVNNMKDAQATKEDP